MVCRGLRRSHAGGSWLHVSVSGLLGGVEWAGVGRGRVSDLVAHGFWTTCEFAGAIAVAVAAARVEEHVVVVVRGEGGVERAGVGRGRVSDLLARGFWTTCEFAGAIAVAVAAARVEEHVVVVVRGEGALLPVAAVRPSAVRVGREVPLEVGVPVSRVSPSDCLRSFVAYADSAH